MRRVAVLACAVACFVAAPPAGAVITPNRNAPEVAATITSPSTAGRITAASFPEIPPAGNPVAVSTTPLGGFPLVDSSYAILSSGNTLLAPSADQTLFAGVNNSGAATTARGNALDVTVMRLDVNVPAGANCLTLGFRFLSEEYPGFVGGSVNDGFIAQVDTNTWTGTGSGITAQDNFAFDDRGEVVSVNTMPIGTQREALPSVTAEASGTIYNGATPRLSAAKAVTPGQHTLYLSLFDQGDANYDSAVFIDRLAFLATEAGGCIPGAQSDEVPPAVTLGVTQGSAHDSTPTFSGAAGDATGDAATVSVKVFAGGAASGTPVQTLTANRTGTTYSVDAAALTPGTYTAQAEQTDIAGNTGVSGPSTFAVAAMVQVVEGKQDQSPEPELGKTVVAGAVGPGTVKIRLGNGKFRTLGANESIPLGSEIDATKGRVRLTSAAGPGGVVQTADFYKGAFIVTQTKGTRPITQLALSAKLACTTKKKGKASAAAKKKTVRRLWGDGKGRFRTRGRRAAATVRGTKWLTEDRCDRTKITVRRGSVTVRDFVKRKNKIVKQGKSYTARVKGKK
jgi:hypothetical protein